MNKNTFSGFPAITGGEIPEAPIDGRAYGRQDEAWVETLTKVEIENIKLKFIVEEGF